MRVHRRLLVTLVLTAIVSITVSSGALAALRSFSGTTTNTSVSGVSGFDRAATPASGDPDAGGTGQPVTGKSLTLHSTDSGGFAPVWRDWISRLWVLWLARSVR